MLPRPDQHTCCRSCNDRAWRNHNAKPYKKWPGPNFVSAEIHHQKSVYIYNNNYPIPSCICRLCTENIKQQALRSTYRTTPESRQTLSSCHTHFSANKLRNGGHKFTSNNVWCASLNVHRVLVFDPVMNRRPDQPKQTTGTEHRWTRDEDGVYRRALAPEATEEGWDRGAHEVTFHPGVTLTPEAPVRFNLV